MNEKIGPLRELDKTVGPCRIARDHDRPIGSIEPKGECRHHGGMIDKGCPDGHLVIAHDEPPFVQLVDMNQRDKWYAAFVSDPRVDVGLIHFEESSLRRSVPSTRPVMNQLAPRYPIPASKWAVGKPAQFHSGKCTSVPATSPISPSHTAARTGERMGVASRRSERPSATANSMMN